MTTQFKKIKSLLPEHFFPEREPAEVKWMFDHMSSIETWQHPLNDAETLKGTKNSPDRSPRQGDNVMNEAVSNEKKFNIGGLISSFSSAKTIDFKIFTMTKNSTIKALFVSTEFSIKTENGMYPFLDSFRGKTKYKNFKIKSKDKILVDINLNKVYGLSGNYWWCTTIDDFKNDTGIYLFNEKLEFQKTNVNEAKKVEIKKSSSNEANASKRHISYDIYVDGKYDTTINDINDALDYKEKKLKENFNEEFSAGELKLNDGSTMKINKQDASILEKVYSELTDKNKKAFSETALKNKKSLTDFLKFAKEHNDD